MSAIPSNPVIQQVMTERDQSPETRRRLFAELEKGLGRPVLAYFTSFRYPVMIEPQDVDIIEGILQKMDLKKGLALLVSSPGGDGLAAERLIRVCRQYSGTGEYWAVVPSKAKSAATMACFGASKILMSRTSELGPVDPQVPIVTPDGAVSWQSAWTIVGSYKTLFTRSTREKGRLEGYLQQLDHYDAREIAGLEAEIALSEDISTRALASGMMSKKSKREITKKIAVFLTPQLTKTHGRPIFADEAVKCGLKVDVQSVTSGIWANCYELFIRMDQYVSMGVCKSIETQAHAFGATFPGKDNA